MTSTKNYVDKHILLVSKYSDDPQEYTYATSFARALQMLGLRVTTFNTKKNYLPWPAKNHDYLPARFKWLNNLLVNWQLKRVVTHAQPDVVFFIKAENVHWRTVRWMSRLAFDTSIRHSREGGNPKLITFYPDNPFSFWNGNSNSNVLLSLPYYDLFLIWEQSLIAQLQAAGARRVAYFPFAYDEQIFNAVAVRDVLRDELALHSHEQSEGNGRVCFVGTWDAEREAWLSSLKAHLPHINLGIWGNGWEQAAQRHPFLKDSLKDVAIYGAAMVNVFTSSAIVLNFIRKQNLEGHNMRTFEVLACGAFMLTQRTRDQITPPFYEDSNICCFSTKEELIKKISYYLEHPAERMLIAQRGLELAKEYTITKQLQKLFEAEGGLL